MRRDSFSLAHVLYDGEAYECAMVLNQGGRLEGFLSSSEVQELRAGSLGRVESGSGSSSAMRLLDPRRTPCFSTDWQRRAVDNLNRYFARAFGSLGPLDDSWPSFGQRYLSSVVEGVEGARVLDLGAGAGRYGLALREAGAASVVNLDLAIPRRRCEMDRGVKRAERSVGSGAELPFRDASFTLVLCVFVLEHTADPQAVLAEAARVLAPGGRLVIAVPSTTLRELLETGLLRRRRTMPVQHVRTFGPFRSGFMASLPAMVRQLKHFELAKISVITVSPSGRSGTKHREAPRWPWNYVGAQTLVVAEKVPA